ncbi:hypothetical protein GCM10027093_49060 [Paraburkholderia jirisanensis]
MLVASTITHERALTAGGGTCANAVLAISEAGNTTPSVTARPMDGGTKDAIDERPEVEKRIGSVRADADRGNRA